MGDQEFITAGGIAAIVSSIGFIVGLWTKFMLDRRKMDSDADDKLIVRLESRVVDLEKENRLCMERNVEMSKQIGFLQARCESLEKYVEDNKLPRIE